MQNISRFFDVFGFNRLIQIQLDFAMQSPEHPIHHPERWLIRHIDICVGRGFNTLDSSLTFAAMLHDITKSGFCPALWTGRKGQMKPCEGTFYWQNIHHGEQAGDFCQLLRGYIPSDIFQDVQAICVNHMKMKNFLAGERGELGGLKQSKRLAFEAQFSPELFAKLRTFSEYIDNMKLK